MKRALSLLLCVAMLMSMVVVGTSAVEDTGEAVWDASLVSEENTKTAITFSLDKESYKPGDIVEVTAHVDSMWGDLSIPGRMPGFDQGFMPGMYGIGSIQTCLIYDTNVFTIPKGIKNLFRTSTITNADVATYDATPVKMAQSLNEQGKGYISVIMTAGNALNADEDAYAALGGSGDFFTAYFKIADNAPAGEYEFIVGAYTFADGTPSFETTDTFYGVDYTRKNNCFNYNSEDIDVTYNIPEIVVEGNDVDPDLEAAQEVDALIDAIGDCFIVDPKTEAQLVAAEEAYAALTDAQKALVTKYDTLVQKRKDYDETVAWDNNDKADKVEKLIDAIGEVTYNSGDAIAAAEEAYAALTEAQKKLVDNYEKLAAARAEYDRIYPIMNVENLIANIPDFFAEGTKVYFTDAYNNEQNSVTNGYQNLPLTNGENVTTDSTVEFDYMYSSYTTERTTPRVGILRGLGNAMYIGYNFESKAFEAGGAAWIAKDDTTVHASTPYDLKPNKIYHFAFTFEGKVATLSLDGVQMLSYDFSQGGDSNVLFTMLMPLNVESYFANLTVTAPDAVTDPLNNDSFRNGTYKLTPFDVKTPNDVEAAVVAAEEAYAALTDEQQALVSNYADLVAARKAVNEAKLNPDDVAAAEAVDALIDAIGDCFFVDPETEAQLVAAEEAYAALTDAQKALVTKYDTLVQKRKDYDETVAWDNNDKADKVEKLIDAIGEVTYNSGDAIAAAEEAYAALTEAQKKLVDNYEKLAAARAEYDRIYPIMNVENLIANIPDFFAEGTKVYFTDAYNNEQNSVTNGYQNLPLTNGENVTTDSTVEFDYMYSSYTTERTTPRVGILRGLGNAMYIGYNFESKAFEAGGAAWIAKDDTTVHASTPYDLKPNKIYHFAFTFEGKVATLSLDGVQMLSYDFSQGGDSNVLFTMLMPLNVESYFANLTVTAPDAVTDPLNNDSFRNGTYKLTPFDVKTPNDVEAAVVAAEEAYAALTDEQQALVSNYADLVAARKAVNEAKADKVEKLIDAIGEVTYNSGDAIAAAEEAYAALTDEQKALVDNYDVLVAAIAKYNSTEVTGVSAIAEEGKITVNWNAVKDAGIYYIYCDGKVVGSVWNYLTTTYTFAAAPGEHSVYVDVYVKGEHNAYGTASAPVAVTVPEKVLPTANASATYNSITLTWDAVDGAAYYYVKTTIAGTSYIAKVYGTAHTINYLAADTEYTVNIEAVRGYANNKVDKVDFAPVVATTTTAPAVRVTVDGDKYIVEWDAFDNTVIYYVKAKIGANNYIIPVSASSTTRTITAIADADYSITVEAYHSPKTTSAGYDIYSVYTYAAATNH